MNTHCYRCNAAIPEGSAFCPNCGAPQIRVNVGDEPAGSDQQAPPPLPPQVPVPGALNQSDFGTRPPNQPNYVPPPTPQRLNFSAALPVAAMFGAGIAVLSSTPILSLLNVVCCLWNILGGALAVVWYLKRNPGTLTIGTGAKLGALTGSFAFGFQTIFLAGITMLQMVLGRSPMIKDVISKAFADAMARSSNPEAAKALESLQTPGGMAFILVLILGVSFLVSVLFTMIGGMVGASATKK